MKSYFTGLLASLLLLAAISQPVAAKQGDANPVEKIKAKVAKLGVGEKA